MAPGSCRQSISLSSGPPLPGGGLCGNGVIDVSSGEQCDTGLTSGNSLCTSTCRLNTSGSTNPGACARGILDCPNGFTTPGSSPIEILFKRSGASPRPVSTYKWIVGNNVPVFEVGDSFTLTAPFPVLLSGGKAAVSSTSEHLNGTVTEFTLPNNCIGQGSINYGSGNISCDPAGIILFTADANGKLLPSSGGGAGMNFSGNTARISGASADVNPLTSPGSAVYQNNFAINVGYLFEPLWVRVSKPAVSNTAGGNAYLGAQVGASVNSITEDFLNSLKKGNFTVTSTTRSGVATFGAENATGTKQAGTTNLSKFSDAPSSTPEQTIVIDSMDDFEAALASGKFTKTGDAKGLYVLKKGTVTLRSAPGSSELRIKGIGTLLIEEGTLIIETDVEYEDANSSWAFIVKKPKTSSEPAIQVASSVTQISGAYLALSGEMTGNGPSTRPLAVDGNVNANIAKLVSDRTFIRANEGSSALSTGVTINYSTRAFKNPPPLLSQYLEQYNLEKISR